MTRKHVGKRNEDYLEAILLLAKEKRIIRIKDIAEKLNVKKSTVVSMIEKLAQEEFLIHERYGDVFLTEKGTKQAKKIYHKHTTIYSFLKDVLGIQDSIASNEACNLEHYMSDTTIKKLVKFVEFFKLMTGRNNKTFLELKEYYKSGKKNK